MVMLFTYRKKKLKHKLKEFFRKRLNDLAKFVHLFLFSFKEHLTLVSFYLTVSQIIIIMIRNHCVVGARPKKKKQNYKILFIQSTKKKNLRLLSKI